MIGIPLKNKLLIAGVAAAAAVALVAAPASATTIPTGPFGDLFTINATGGTGADDGLKVDIAQGQIQVNRGGDGQLYPSDALPSNLTSEMNNYFSVAFDDGTVHTINPQLPAPAASYDADLVWNSATSSETPSTDGKSGTVVNTLTSEDTGHGVVILEITYSYLFPDQFVNVSTKLTLPAEWSFPTRLYWNTDSTLAGGDAGNQVEGTLANGQFVRGVIARNGSQIEAFRQVVGQSLNSWAGGYPCPWEDGGTDCNPASTYGWVVGNQDAPNAISTGRNVDNGFGISVPVVNAPGDHLASFDILFVTCLSGITAIECLNAGTGAVAEVPTLANTGINAAQGGLLAGGAALFALVGAGLVIARRRKVNN